MIRITVELLSARDKSRNKVLAVMQIANDGTGNHDKSSYDGRVLRAPNFVHTTREGRVEDYNRNANPVWVLIAKMLIKMGYDK